MGGITVEQKTQTDRLRKLTLFAEHVPTLMAQHKDIIRALIDQKPIEAAEAMRLHLRNVVEN